MDINFLTGMGKVPVEFTLDAMQGLRHGQATDEMNLAELQRKHAYEQEMDPLRLEQQRLVNTHQDTVNQKGVFDLASLTRKDAMERSLFGVTQQAKLKELLSNTSESERKLFEEELFRRFQSTKPGTQAHRDARAALEATKGFVEDQKKADLRMREVAANNANQVKLEQMRIDAGKYKKADRFSIGFEAELARAKGHVQKLAVVQQYLGLAQADPDLKDLIPSLMTLREQLRVGAEAELTGASPRPGAPDISRLTNGGVPTVPTRPVAPVGNPASAAAPTKPRKPLGEY